MSRNRIGILIVIFLLLGAYVYFYETGKGEKKGQPEKKVKVIDVIPEDVREIIIVKGDQSAALRMAEGQWRVTRPVDFSVPAQKVNDLLSFFNYGIVREIDQNPKDLAQYGLDKPTYEFWIKTKGDDTFKVLFIGGDAPGNISSYAKVKGQTKVVLLGVRYRQELERALLDLSQAPDAK